MKCISTPHTKKERQVMSNIKGMVGDIFDCDGIAHQAKWLNSIATRRFCNM
jgi:hypothetical protein